MNSSLDISHNRRFSSVLCSLAALSSLAIPTLASAQTNSDSTLNDISKYITARADAFKRDGKDAAYNLTFPATSNYIPVYFAIPPRYLQRVHPAFHSQSLRAFDELNNDFTRQNLEIRGDLAQSLDNKGVKAVILEVGLKTPIFGAQPGYGLVFIEESSGVLTSKSFNISPFEFDRNRSGRQPNGSAIWGLDYFKVTEDPSLPTNEAIVRIGKELREAVANIMDVPDSQRDNTPKNNFELSKFFQHVSAPFASDEALSSYSHGKSEELVKAVLENNPDADEQLKKLKSTITDSYEDFDKLSRTEIPNSLEQEMSRFKASLPLIREFAKRDLSFVVASAALDYSFTSDSLPDPSTVNLKTYADILEQELLQRVNNVQVLADSLQSQLSAIEETKRQQAEKEQRALDNKIKEAKKAEEMIRKEEESRVSIQPHHSQSSPQQSSTGGTLDPVWIFLGGVAAGAIGLVGLLLSGGSSTRYRSSPPAPTPISYDEEPSYGGEAQTRNPNASSGD